MNINPAVLTAAFSALAAILCGLMVYKNAKRANDQTMSSTQLQWVQQAMAEASSAKEDARQAKSDAKDAESQAASATAKAQQAEAKLQRVDVQIRELLAWIERVVVSAHATDPDQRDQVALLLRIINGGPPSLSAVRANGREP